MEEDWPIIIVAIKIDAEYHRVFTAIGPYSEQQRLCDDVSRTVEERLIRYLKTN